MTKLWIALVFFGAAGAAFAQPYAVAHLGYASADWQLDAPFNGTVDDRALSYGVDVGFGFRHWAIEGGLSGYGDMDGLATPCPAGEVCPLVVREVTGNDMTMYRFALVPRFSVGDVRLFAKAGYFRMKIDTNVDLPGDELDDRGLLLGIGARWFFRDPWSVSVEGLRFDDNQYQVNVGFGWGLRLFSD
ncbi:MAG TPA: outer membrane beta-barrel protein [Gammaproteobacteria bacterium]